MPAAEWERMRDVIAALVPIAGQVLLASFRAAMRERVDEIVPTACLPGGSKARRRGRRSPSSLGRDRRYGPGSTRQLPMSPSMYEAVEREDTRSTALILPREGELRPAGRNRLGRSRWWAGAPG